MVRKKDLLIVLGALIVAAAALIGVTLTRGGGMDVTDVHIYVGGELYATAPLGEEREIVVEQEDGSVNIVALTAQGAYMKHSSCDNQLCVDQGEVTRNNWRFRALGRQIVCLPNRVLVELAPPQGQQLPQGDLPDV